MCCITVCCITVCCSLQAALPSAVVGMNVTSPLTPSPVGWMMAGSGADEGHSLYCTVLSTQRIGKTPTDAACCQPMMGGPLGPLLAKHGMLYGDNQSSRRLQAEAISHATTPTIDPGPMLIAPQVAIYSTCQGPSGPLHDHHGSVMIIDQ